jgi:hypothetical protein
MQASRARRLRFPRRQGTAPRRVFANGGALAKRSRSRPVPGSTATLNDNLGLQLFDKVEEPKARLPLGRINMPTITRNGRHNGSLDAK